MTDLTPYVKRSEPLIIPQITGTEKPRLAAGIQWQRLYAAFDFALYSGGRISTQLRRMLTPAQVSLPQWRQSRSALQGPHSMRPGAAPLRQLRR